MVSDIARRLAIANPGLDNRLEGKGIVLIDEIELHLHPKWQRNIIPSLVQAFPNVQFIVTTHSPQVLSNLERDEIIILEDFKIIEETPYNKGRDSNSILLELQGVQERPEFSKKEIKELYHKIDEKDLKRAKEILNNLSEIFGHNDSEILKAQLHIDFIADER